MWGVALWAAASLWAQAPSDELNQVLPGWLRFSGEYRARFEAPDEIGFQGGQDDAYLLNRIRLNLRIAPTDWLKFVFQAQDARVFGNSVIHSVPPYKASMDLRMGYLELGDPESRPVSLLAGRQELIYGEQRLVGNTNWSNAARTFDAVRGVFRFSGWRLDAWASSVVVIQDGQFDQPNTGNNFHGLYASNPKLVPGGTVEGYALWRLAPGVKGEDGVAGHLNFATVGTRWVGKLPRRLDYNNEMALQRGSLAHDHVDAWAGHWVLGHTCAARFEPRLFGEYNFATGDQNPRDGTHGTFDVLYPTPHGKYGLADQVGWKNIHDVRLGAEIHPGKKFLLAASVHDYWLASARDWLYSSAGAPLFRSANGSAGRHVGEEIDAYAVWTATKQLQLGAGVGHVIPGEFLNQTSPGHGFTYPYLMLDYSF